MLGKRLYTVYILDNSTPMITLYVKTGCPYCHKVIEACTEHGIAFDEKNIADAAVYAELMEKGGKPQVPFMVGGDITMYESDAIIAHVLGTPATDTDTAAGCDAGVCNI